MSQKVGSLPEAVSHTLEEMVNHTGDPHIPVIMQMVLTLLGKQSVMQGVPIFTHIPGNEGPIFT